MDNPALRFTSLFLLFLCSLQGCTVRTPYEDASDPLEPMNRAVYDFNDGFDRAVWKPIALGYKKVVPAVGRTGVRNVLKNIMEPLTITNQLLQGKGELALQDTMRFLFNTTFGVLGLMDVSTGWGLPRHREDFGQTFAVWGVGDGWYLVLPVFGPSSGRDAIGLVLDFQMDPITLYTRGWQRIAYYSVWLVSLRADLLGATDILDAAAVDPYLQVREAYRQKRWFDIHDGEPPEPDFFDDDELFLEE